MKNSTSLSIAYQHHHKIRLRSCVSFHLMDEDRKNKDKWNGQHINRYTDTHGENMKDVDVRKIILAVTEIKVRQPESVRELAPMSLESAVVEWIQSDCSQDIQYAKWNQKIRLMKHKKKKTIAAKEAVQIFKIHDRKCDTVNSRNNKYNNDSNSNTNSIN